MKKIFLLLVFLFANDGIALALTMSDLYQANIPVTQQTTAAPDPALVQQGLQSVLIKVSGNSQIAAVPAIAAGLKNAINYLAEYSVQNNVLALSFDPSQVNQLLRDAGQAVWSGERPAVLVWVAVEDKTNARLLGADTTDPILVSLQTLAAERAIPLVFPAMDLTDLNQISVSDVWSNNVSVIQTASKRYENAAIIVAQLTQNTDGSWASSWESVNVPGAAWKFSGKALTDVITPGLNNALDAMAHSYLAINPRLQTKVLLTVTQINNLNDYAKITNDLQHLQLVKQVQVKTVATNQIQFELTIDGNESDLQRALSLAADLIPVGNVTIPAVAPAAASSASAVVTLPTVSIPLTYALQ